MAKGPLALKEQQRINVQAMLDAKTQASGTAWGSLLPLQRSLWKSFLCKEAHAMDSGNPFPRSRASRGAFYPPYCKPFQRPESPQLLDMKSIPTMRTLFFNFGRKPRMDVRLSDFTKASPPEEGFNLSDLNPPYVRHHHLING